MIDLEPQISVDLKELAEQFKCAADYISLENAILGHVLSGNRLNNEAALFLWRHGNFRNMGNAAFQVRNQKHDANEVSYTAFRVVNYTNYCNIECSFCSFMDEVGSGKGYTLSIDEILKKIAEAIKFDSPQLFLQGGVNPDLPFDWYLNTLRAIRKEYPDLHIRAFSPVEALYLEKITGLTLAEVFTSLKEAGMNSFPGAGAEILTDRMRDILSPKKSSTSEWVRAMQTAQMSGLPGSSNIVWGSEETDEEIIEHLHVLRSLQDTTGGVLSFVPWTFQAQTKKFRIRKVPSHEYLRMVALARLYFDNIDHIEISIMVAGKQLGELGLFWGGDDINSPVIEENVLRSFGLKSVQEAEKFIHDSGFVPVRRNFNFERGKKSLV
ncbi:MAG: CofH family radical SAM protein [Leptospiraceae bacterium]|nr:CofH family radical SAM protein [Leptospiraceae bacterium]